MKSLEEAEALWLRSSDEEAFELDLFCEKPIIVRRLKKFPKTLASLTFGQYDDMQHQKVQSDLTIWINFITSEESGQGMYLIQFLKTLAKEYGLALGAQPQPLRPKKWHANRHFYHRSDEMIAWYKKHLFTELKFKDSSQVWYFPTSLKPEINLRINLEKSQAE